VKRFIFNWTGSTPVWDFLFPRCYRTCSPFSLLPSSSLHERRLEHEADPHFCQLSRLRVCGASPALSNTTEYYGAWAQGISINLSSHWNFCQLALLCTNFVWCALEVTNGIRHSCKPQIDHIILLLSKLEINRSHIRIEFTRIRVMVFMETWIQPVIWVYSRRVTYIDLSSIQLDYPVRFISWAFKLLLNWSIFSFSSYMFWKGKKLSNFS
jgi:hypothetical protein